MTDNNARMGDLFNQRRAAKRGSQQQQQQQQQQEPRLSSSSSNAAPSFLDIQAEQEKNRSSSRNYSGNRSSPNRSGSFRNDRRGGRGRRDYSHLPIEQGCISSLKDAFGFIYCANRPEEIFFHYSELNGIHSDDLQVDDEVEFRVGPSRDNDKVAAFQVIKLEPGTIEWEVEEEPGARFQGLVERPVRSERGSYQASEGTIRMLVPHDEDDNEGEATAEEGEIAAAATGPLIRYTANDYTPQESEQQGGTNKDFRRFDSSVSNSSRGGSRRLGRNDLVEFTLVTERRTGNQMARSITLLQSERERQRLAREKQLLANATVEQGVVTSLKTDYGFLRSNRRREEVYFHYSHVDLPDDDDEEDEEGDEEKEHFVLKEGQDMDFLVLTEPGTDGRRDKLSAREVKVLPKGTVVFEKLVAEGVTGVVTRPPHPADAGYASDMVGRVRLSEPLEKTGDDGNVTVIDEILFYSKDSPGGTFSANRDGSSVGLWVREGDALLFDVIQDVIDDSYRVAPTKHMQPTVVEESKEEVVTSVNHEKAVRLMAESLAGRAEGTIHAIKEGYGFISCAERPVDVYFRLYELLPDHMQNDLRRNMGIETGDWVPELKVGAQVQYDMSLQGIVAIGNHRSRNRLGGSSERENLKGQRLLLLPPNTFVEDKVIATDAKGVVSKEDQKQNYAGFIEFDETRKAMSYEERHPLVAKLIRSILEDDSTNQSPVIYHDVQSMQEDDVVVNMVEELGKGSLACTHIPVSGVTGHPGRLCISKVGAEVTTDAADGPSTGDDSEKPPSTITEEPTAGPGESMTVDENAQNTGQSLGQSGSKRGKRKRKRPKTKEIKSLHYDKHCLCKELAEDIPPGVGDVVLCDIVQSRRTGAITVRNVRVTERRETERAEVNGKGDSSKPSGVGIVTEVVAASKFGFISLLDENASRREMLFFQFANIVDAPTPENSMASSLHSSGGRGNAPVKKGDEVKFDIGVAKKGKRTAVNIHVVPRGTLNIPTRAEKNACRGLVLMEPSHTTLSNTPARQASRGTAAKGTGRWENVDSEHSSKGGSGAKVNEEGRILLVNDPTNMFAIRTLAKKEEAESTDEATSSDRVTEPEDATKEEPVAAPKPIGRTNSSVQSAVGTLVSYKNGAVAIHGAGASSGADGSGAPRRGDLVSFVKARSGRGVRDIRVVERGAATMQRGRLEDISLTSDSESSASPGTAKFIAATEKEEEYDIDLADVVSCSVSILKDKESVEGILHDGKIYGICRTSDLYLGSKLGKGHKERPKLNLTVRKELKKNLGGKIMAQSMMAKGPDGTNGFAPGWTSRVSQYAPPPEEIPEDANDESKEEKESSQGGEEEPSPSDGKSDAPKESVEQETPSTD